MLSSAMISSSMVRSEQAPWSTAMVNSSVVRKLHGETPWWLRAGPGWRLLVLLRHPQFQLCDPPVAFAEVATRLVTSVFVGEWWVRDG